MGERYGLAVEVLQLLKPWANRQDFLPFACAKCLPMARLHVRAPDPREKGAPALRRSLFPLILVTLLPSCGDTATAPPPVGNILPVG